MPSRSHDLKPLDQFLWSYVKSLVYADKPATLKRLKVNLQATAGTIRLDLFEQVIKNLTERMDTITVAEMATFNVRGFKLLKKHPYKHTSSLSKLTISKSSPYWSVCHNSRHKRWTH